MLSKHSINWVTSPAPTFQFFQIIYLLLNFVGNHEYDTYTGPDRQPNEFSLNFEPNFAWSQVALLPILLSLSSLSSQKTKQNKTNKQKTKQTNKQKTGFITWLNGVLRIWFASAREPCHLGMTLCCPFNSQKLWPAQDWEPSWPDIELGRDS